MYKNLIVLFAAAVSLASCDKVKPKTPCGPQVCTDLFASVGIHYIDNTGKPIAVNNFTVFNVTSNKPLHPGYISDLLVLGYYIVATDNNKMDYSTDGDDIKVSATDPVTNQTKIVDLKISGSCNCHVAKISGPDTVKFD
ncbi:MAG TPA: hypothetical protein VL442_12150 [Mucilaginibacter sp.]|jgi:hypothetical protein|nr:hypothetical protein [Mucilaginibacter sp.]